MSFEGQKKVGGATGSASVQRRADEPGKRPLVQMKQDGDGPKPPNPQAGDADAGKDAAAGKDAGAAEGAGKEPAGKEAGLAKLAVRRADVFDEMEEDEFNFYVKFFATTPGGETVYLGKARVELEDGAPSAAPVMTLDTRVTVGGQQFSVDIFDDVTPDGKGTGARHPFTGYALDRLIVHHNRRFGQPPERLEGILGFKNLENFQREYGKAKTGGADHDAAGQHAIRNISFGKHRIARGYDRFELELGPLRDLPAESGETLHQVPLSVFVIARRSAPLAEG